MGNTAQAGFNTTNNNRNVFKRLAATLGINGDCAVGALAAFIVGRISIVVAQLFIRGVAVNHGVHVAGRHTKIQIGLAQLHKVVFILPVRLGNNAHPVTVCFQQAPDDCHTKTGVVHVRVACDQNNIAAIPAQFVHFGP